VAHLLQPDYNYYFIGTFGNRLFLPWPTSFTMQLYLKVFLQASLHVWISSSGNSASNHRCIHWNTTQHIREATFDPIQSNAKAKIYACSFPNGCI